MWYYTRTSSKGPAAISSASLSEKGAVEAVATTVTKTAALDADVAVVVAVMAIMAAAATRDAEDVDTTGKRYVRVKVPINNKARAPTTKTA